MANSFWDLLLSHSFREPVPVSSEELKAKLTRAKGRRPKRLLRDQLSVAELDSDPALRRLKVKELLADTKVHEGTGVLLPMAAFLPTGDLETKERICTMQTDGFCKPGQGKLKVASSSPVMTKFVRLSRPMPQETQPRSEEALFKATVTGFLPSGVAEWLDRAGLLDKKAGSTARNGARLTPGRTTAGLFALVQWDFEIRDPALVLIRNRLIGSRVDVWLHTTFGNFDMLEEPAIVAA